MNLSAQILRTALGLLSAASVYAGELPAAPVVDPTQDLGFCREWNPDFSIPTAKRVRRGRKTVVIPAPPPQCCRPLYGKRGRAPACPANRVKWSFCGDMTPEQTAWETGVSSGEIRDPLAALELSFLEEDLGTRRYQAVCMYSNGFLANGRPIMGTSENRVIVKNAKRCTHFATDRMAALVEWTGRQLRQQYPRAEAGRDGREREIRMILGDFSAPRGGCIASRKGRRAHKSHTNGRDGDVAFLSWTTIDEAYAPFTRKFDAELNWKFLKTVFENPYVCLRAVFLDKKLIRALRDHARSTGDLAAWEQVGPWIKHVRGHKHHFHLRVGDGPGLPGCPASTFDPDDDEDSLLESGLESQYN